ncbi:hypothetical protein [Modicisalibacter radicis]|uniref:hypothetical protein n=1 Tax=Halomonas sp. EAR18 TaxID=2518972 RepID=UPI00109D124E|nr:hypothetical protein [Halomonas sp. EAR18]
MSHTLKPPPRRGATRRKPRMARAAGRPLDIDRLLDGLVSVAVLVALAVGLGALVVSLLD